MKRLIAYLAMMAFAFSAGAQCYVYEVNGGVYVRKASGWEAAYKTQQLALEDSLKTDAYSSLVVLDRENDKVYSFQTEVSRSLSDLIAGQKSKARRLLKEFAQGLWNSLFAGNEKSMDAYHTVSGVTYRGDDGERVIAAALVSSFQESKSMSFRFVDVDTYESVYSVSVGDMAVVEVTNDGDSPMYFNIIDVDSEGNAFPLMPFDERHTMLHLYVPPHSVVRLRDLPIEFCEPRGTDEFILVAYPFPFNLMTVLENMGKVQGSHSEDVQMNRIKVRIR